jgi:hypothetical protein
MKLMKNKLEGFISIQALWIMMILVILTSGLALRTMLSIKTMKRSLEYKKVEFITRSLSEIICQEIDNADSINSNYNGFYFDHHEIINIAFKSDTFEIQIHPGTYAIFSADTCRFDEESKININTAPQHILSNIFKDQFLVDEIIESRKSIELSQNPDSVAFDSTILSESAGKPFDSVDELLRLSNCDIRDLKELKHLLTIFGNGLININTASDKVLELTDCPYTLLSKINSIRRTASTSQDVSNGNIFLSTETLIADLINSGCEIEPEEANYLKDMQNYNLLGATSMHFTFTIECNKLNSIGNYVMSQTVCKNPEKPLEYRQSIIWN